MAYRRKSALANWADRIPAGRILAVVAIAAAAALSATPAQSGQSKPAQAAPAEVQLRTDIAVDGAAVTFGDLVEGAGDLAGRRALDAPAPGQRLVYPVAQIASLIGRAGLKLDYRFLPDRIAIRRNGDALSRDELSQSLARALEQAGAVAPMVLEMRGRDLALMVPPTAPAAVEVRNLNYDKASGRFTANLAAVVGFEEFTLPVVGRSHPAVAVPVLRRAVNPGEVIAAADVTLAEVRYDQLQQSVAASEEEIVGSILTSRVPPGQPLPLRLLKRPVAVDKGQLVEMEYHIGGLYLSAYGKALAGGGVGDVIQVLNAGSNRAVEVKIIAPGKVRATGIRNGRITALAAPGRVN